jgi:uncharacterized protein (TIGR04255 family)
MSNAPVYYVLAQARFNPVAAMTKYVDQIQDRLRREGYPLFEPQQFTQLLVPGPGQAQPQPPQIQQTVSWLMTRGDRSSGFVLAPSMLIYHTTHYQTHGEFISELLRGLTAVHETVSLDHVSRLGLRYLDAILPRDGETTGQYLVGGLHGIDFNAVCRCRHAMTESVFTTDTGPLVSKGTLVVRVYQMTAPLSFPPDMLSAGLTIAPKFEIKNAREHAIIDTDHYVEEQMPVEMDKLNEQLLSLHATIKSVFRATTTDYARSAWA